MIEHRTEDTASACSVCDDLAEWEPVVWTWPHGGKMSAPTSFEVDMPICDSHRLQLRTTDFLCDEIWSGILEWAHRNNKPIPDINTAEVRFKKINNEKVLH